LREAVRGFEEAIDLFKRAFHETGDPLTRRSLANALESLAGIRSDLGDHDSSISMLRDAASQFRALIEAGYLLARRDLADTFNSLANQYLRTDNPRESVEAASAAVDIGTQLALEDPGASMDERLASYLSMFAEALAQSGRYQSAWEAYAQATTTLARAIGPLDEMDAELRRRAALQLARLEMSRGLAAARAERWDVVDVAVEAMRQLLHGDDAAVSPTTFRRAHAILAQAASLSAHSEEARGNTLKAIRAYEEALMMITPMASADDQLIAHTALEILREHLALNERLGLTPLDRLVAPLLPVLERMLAEDDSTDAKSDSDSSEQAS
jgi:hypothetical protein